MNKIVIVIFAKSVSTTDQLNHITRKLWSKVVVTLESCLCSLRTATECVTPCTVKFLCFAQNNSSH